MWAGGNQRPGLQGMPGTFMLQTNLLQPVLPAVLEIEPVAIQMTRPGTCPDHVTMCLRVVIECRILPQQAIRDRHQPDQYKGNYHIPCPSVRILATSVSGCYFMPHEKPSKNTLCRTLDNDALHAAFGLPKAMGPGRLGWLTPWWRGGRHSVLAGSGNNGINLFLFISCIPG